MKLIQNIKYLISFQNGKYANVVIENNAFFESRRDYLISYNLIDTSPEYCNRLNEVSPPTQPTIPDPPTRPPIVDPWRYLKCPGTTYIRYDMSGDPIYKNENEELVLDIRPRDKDGLIWYTESGVSKFYVSLKVRHFMLFF